LTLFTDARDWQSAQASVPELQRRGIDRQLVTRDQAFAIEPALRPLGNALQGAVYAASDESGDAHVFCERLADACAKRGVVFRLATTVLGMSIDDKTNQAVGVRVAQSSSADFDNETLTADAFVVCLGSHTPLLTRPLGIDLPIFPAKGYSVTLPVIDPSKAPTVSLTDEAEKLVFSRLGDRLRVAGTAELCGFDRSIDADRCAHIAQRAAALFPDALDTARAIPWAGLRPATPSGVPTIGRTRFSNLFLNSGQGTLGWTLACGSGQAIAKIINGEQPTIGFPFR
jgi:D-amino-acid dehydrogenase